MAAHLQYVQICTDTRVSTHIPAQAATNKVFTHIYTYIHIHLRYKTHRHNSSLWREIVWQPPLSKSLHSNMQAYSTDPILCLKWQQGAELLFALPFAMVFVWLHAYCAVIEHSDPGSKGGLLTNRLHSEKTQAPCAVHVIFRWYTCSVYACIGRVYRQNQSMLYVVKFTYFQF